MNDSEIRTSLEVQSWRQQPPPPKVDPANGVLILMICASPVFIPWTKSGPHVTASVAAFLGDARNASLRRSPRPPR